MNYLLEVKAIMDLVAGCPSLQKGMTSGDSPAEVDYNAALELAIKAALAETTHVSVSDKAVDTLIIELRVAALAMMGVEIPEAPKSPYGDFR